MELLIIILPFFVGLCAAVIFTLIWHRGRNKEGSFIVEPKFPPPTPPIKSRPLITEWLTNGRGVFFKKSDVVVLTENPDKTINVILLSGDIVNTGMRIDDAKKALGIDYCCTVDEELKYRKAMLRK